MTHLSSILKCTYYIDIREGESNVNRRLDKKKQQKKAESANTPVKAETPAVQTEVNFYIQYQDQEYLEEEIIAKVKEKCKADGVSSEELKTLSIYLKPEDQKVYYTTDTQISGAVDL